MSRTQTWALPINKSRPPVAARLFMSLLERLQGGWLTVRTPNGESMGFGDMQHGLQADLSIHDWRACERILSRGDIGLAQAWRAGWVDSSEPAALLRLAIRNDQVLQQALFGKRLARWWFRLCHWLRPNSRGGSRRNIHAHYDIGNAFYQLWLDDSMTYSAACYDGQSGLSLEQAQAAKYQRIIDQLGLRAGQRVLEIGCGWGGFALHAARQGIQVHGITISASQLALAQERVRAEGLAQLARLELRDYRDLDEQYDAIVSIEMFEAVGERYWPDFFRVLHEQLKPGGQALIQSITIDESHFEQYRSSSDFIRQYVFPGGMLPSPPRFMTQADAAGLPCLQAWAFGRDYAQTLRLWRARFQARLAEVEAQGYDLAFQRIWTLYLAYCEAGFDEGRTDVYHFLLRKPAGLARG